MIQIDKEKFKEILRKGNYAPYRQTDGSVLESACLNAIKESEGAIMYPDLVAPLGERLEELYDQGKILQKSYRFKYSDHEEGKRITLEQLRNYRWWPNPNHPDFRLVFTVMAENQLKIFRRDHYPKSFDIDEVYGIIRKELKLKKRDILKVQSGTYREYDKRKSKEFGYRTIAYTSLDSAMKLVREINPIRSISSAKVAVVQLV